MGCSLKGSRSSFAESAGDAVLFLRLAILLKVGLLMEPVALDKEDASLIETLFEDDFRCWPLEEKLEPLMEFTRSRSFRFFRSPTFSTVPSVQDKSALNIALRTSRAMKAKNR